MDREASTPQVETGLKRPSLTRKALISLLGGFGIFAATNVYGALAGDHNDQVRDAQAAEAKQFDITRAKVTWAINLDNEAQAPAEDNK